MAYKLPEVEIQFLLERGLDTASLLQLPIYADLSLDLFQSVIEQSAKYIEQQIVPLNVRSDREPARLVQGQVVTTPGFKEAYNAFVEAGWQGLSHQEQYEGQGLPNLLNTIIGESLSAANPAFALCPLLTDSVIEAIAMVGTEEQKQCYLPPLIQGRWAGTMNLTESQAGSDLSQIKAIAAPQEDGSYRLTGEKIFISYGDHDLTENIIHLVLARTTDAPAGIRGLSLFIVPKYLSTENGTQLNDVNCASLEHKLGLHGSPTAVMRYGDEVGQVGKGAVAYLLGDLNRGLEYMFITMNAARFAVAVQALGVAENAYQLAYAYAAERQQGTDIATKDAQLVAINQHPDVARMLQTMKATIQGGRGLVYYGAWLSDMAQHSPEPQHRAQYQRWYEFLVPVIKGFITESVNELSSTAIQVFGGMGYIEETGIAQCLRDSRVFSIYEGTTAIQANDFVGRKVMRDQAQVMSELLSVVRADIERAQQSNSPQLALIANRLTQAVDSLEQAAHQLCAQKANLRAVYTASVPFLLLAGCVFSGWRLLVAAIQAVDTDTETQQDKLNTALAHVVYVLSRFRQYEAVIADAELVSDQGVSLA